MQEGHIDLVKMVLFLIIVKLFTFGEKLEIIQKHLTKLL